MLTPWLTTDGLKLMARNGHPVLCDYCPCEDSESSSSSSGSSSSSSSSGSSSSSSSSGSSSSSSTVNEYIQCTKYNEQPEAPIAFDGPYYLVSGNSNDTSGVWRHADGHELYYDSWMGNWICHVITGYWAGDIVLTMRADKRYDPTTWLHPHCASDLLSVTYDTSVTFCYVGIEGNDGGIMEDDLQ